MSRNENYLGLALPGVGSMLVIMAAQGVFYFVVLFGVESGSGSRARRSMSRLGRRRRHVTQLQPGPSQAVSSLSTVTTTTKHRPTKTKLECGPMPNVMVALPNIGGALCSTPQSLADAHY